MIELESTLRPHGTPQEICQDAFKIPKRDLTPFLCRVVALHRGQPFGDESWDRVDREAIEPRNQRFVPTDAPRNLPRCL